MTSTEFSPGSDNLTESGPLRQMIKYLCGLYLILMLVYLALRLIFGSGVWWLALTNAFAVYTFFPVFVLLPMAILAGLWRMTIRLGMMMLLAVIWFGPFFQPSSVNPSGAPLLRVATFNIENDAERFEANLQKLRDWLITHEVDVLVLQETPGSYETTGIEALKDLFPEQVMQSGEIYGGLRRATLSRFPLTEVENGDTYQRSLIDFDGTTIAIYNVHFAWPFLDIPRISVGTGSDWFDLMLKYDEDRRNGQIEAFLEVVRGEGLPFVVAGDFNMSQHSIIYSQIAVEMRDSFRTSSSGLGATWPVNRLGDLVPPLLRIDYIWNSRSFRAIRSDVGPELGSDHLPVASDLELIIQTNAN